MADNNAPGSGSGGNPVDTPPFPPMPATPVRGTQTPIGNDNADDNNTIKVNKDLLSTSLSFDMKDFKVDKLTGPNGYL